MEKSHISKDKQSKFEELYLQGLADHEIAKEIGVSKTTVWKERRRLNLDPNNGIFGWQKYLEPEELVLIPERYRDKRLYV